MDDIAYTETVELITPDLEATAATDPSFTHVLEGRRSVREYGKKPITVEQLGELLYRSARVRRRIPRDPSDPESYEMSNRPYPSGGAAYDIEIYLTVRECDGLNKGLYHYDPEEHVLRRLPAENDMVDTLLHLAWVSAAQTVVPQVLVTLASRHQRLSWKYRSIGYSVTLRNAGVMYQTLYLVATAMGLAPCGLGSGDSRLFAAASGTDPLVESAVGEFMLGSLPDGG